MVCDRWILTQASFPPSLCELIWLAMAQSIILCNGLHFAFSLCTGSTDPLFFVFLFLFLCDYLISLLLLQVYSKFTLSTELFKGNTSFNISDDLLPIIPHPGYLSWVPGFHCFVACFSYI